MRSSSELKRQSSDPDAKRVGERNDCCCVRCDRFGRYRLLCCCKSREDTFLCLAFVGMALSIVVALGMPQLLKSLLNDGIVEQVVMVPGNPNLSEWKSNKPTQDVIAARLAYSRSMRDPASLVDLSSDGNLHYDLYFFNITNPNEMMRGEKPIVNELGPYSYLEYFQKFDVEWNDDETEVSFNNQKYYVFNEELSGFGLKESDNLYLVNPVVTGFQYLLGRLDANKTAMASVAIQEELNKYYGQIEDGLEKAIDEIDGKHTIPKKIKEPLEAALKNIESMITTFYDSLESFVAQNNPTDILLKVVLGRNDYGITPFMNLKPGPAYFGWLNDTILLEIQAVLNVLEKKTNQTVPWTSAVPGSVVNYTSIEDTRRRVGKTCIKTGKNDVKTAGDLVYYEGMTSIYGCVSPMDSQNTSLYREGFEFPACELFDLNWNESIALRKGWVKPWLTNEANAITGSYGEIFGPPISDTFTPIFIGDIYRGAQLEHSATVDWYNVDLYRLTIRTTDMQNSTVIPANAQYYSDGPMGLLNMTAATGAPAFGSYPHFLDADTRLQQAVDGIVPDESVHMTWLDVEPNTGLLASARKNLQTNYVLNNQTFPATSRNLKEDLHHICGNISMLLIELHKDPLHCNNLSPVDGLFDILYENAGWKLHNGGIDGDLYMPYAWSSEHMTLSQMDAQTILSSVYVVQDIERGCFEWGLICAGAFFIITTTLIVLRIRNGEALAHIVCGESRKPNTAYQSISSTADDQNLMNPLMSDQDTDIGNAVMRESQF